MLIKKNKIPIKQLILVGFLPSFLKKWIYRSKGYKIGKGVSFGLGSIIIGKDVRIGDHTKFGMISVVRGNKIDIRRYVTIGMMTMVDTENIFIDDDARINENVIVGGIKNPESGLSMGKRTIIMEYSFINPTKPITIGDDSGIGGHCLLFTHGSWLNQLDGFPVTFAPITIGERVWLPWRVFIMPGVTIGNDVVIGANSLIGMDLPSNVLAAGSPAKIIKENYPAQLSGDKRASILEQIITDFIEYVRYNEIQVNREAIPGGYLLTTVKKNKTSRMVYLGEAGTIPAVSGTIDLLMTEGNWPGLPKAAMHFDLVGKTRNGKSDLGEELTKYFSRHGVRFDRLD